MSAENHGIYIVNCSVIVSNNGDTSISYSIAFGEMETEIIRCFQSVPLRQRIALLLQAYEYENK